MHATFHISIREILMEVKVTSFLTCLPVRSLIQRICSQEMQTEPSSRVLPYRKERATLIRTMEKIFCLQDMFQLLYHLASLTSQEVSDWNTTISNSHHTKVTA